ncbi:MAG: hypothetical protein DCC55_26245 [Chloroflexi bacterium]|nr:MAG: hypothetical protein DCC55_26245 [Chloroflexota bacterium]
MRVQFVGNKELAATLKKMERGTKNENLRKAMRAGAEIVLADAKRRVPQKTGELRDSIQIQELQSARVDVGSPLVQAPVIEFGWPGHNIKPQPYMRPAFHENRDQVLEAIEREMQGIMGL